MEQQEAIEREQGAVEIQTAKLRELARLVLAYHMAGKDWAGSDNVLDEIDNSYTAMINFAKGVAQ